MAMGREVVWSLVHESSKAASDTSRSGTSTVG